MSDPDLLVYYAARAAEYEKVYEKPERQSDLARLHEVVPKFFDGRRVLEVACGTGYWTRRISPHVVSLVACDLTPETISIAQANQPPRPNVEFVIADAFELDDVSGDFDAGFAGFWWSHVRHDELRRFLDGFHRRLEPGSLVVCIDNNYVEGSNYPITRTDDGGNTYQQRRLEDGSEFEVLKNFPSESDLRETIARAGGVHVSILELQHYWCATYTVSPARPC